jgi:UDP-N-acetyl-D-mannosaminuronic acid transferase (WecB/TagA/CpsF family)
VPCTTESGTDCNQWPQAGTRSLTLKMPADEQQYRRILGIRFFTGSATEAVALGLRGGLVVVPSAPVLVGAMEDPATQAALLDNDLAITDSGLMILIWSLLRRERIPRVSGLEYLKLLLADPSVRAAGASLWVMPGEAAMERNLAWLRAQGHELSREDCYVAPKYPAGPLTDPSLLELVERRKPRHIVMAIGGGVQERLGHYLKRNASFRPGIHCTGAAIGFLSGDQVRIPVWADRFFLGWLFRCVRSPGLFIPRYWKAARLVPMMLRWGARLPQPAA